MEIYQWFSARILQTRRYKTRKKVMKFTLKISLFIALFFPLQLFAQKNKVLTVADFIEKVKQHHPLARVAAIKVDNAKANLLMAKGAFDPTIEFDASNKTFDSKNYYYYNNSSLKVPLPIGDIKTGVENNGGQFLESEITRGRSSYIGVEIPIAKGLLIDKRRAILQQANIAIQQSESQKRALLNNLLLEAYVSYYQWAAAQKLFSIYNSYTQISKDRLKLVVTGNINGDRPTMDTIEAYTQLQNFLLLQADASVKLTSALLDVNNFIWDKDGVSQNIATDVLPDTSNLSKNISTSLLTSLLQNNVTNNPVLQQYQFKIDGLAVEKKLKFQNLLPTINLRGNVLNKDYNILKNAGTSLLENNNRWGISVKIPLRFREGRGEYRMAKLKIEEATLELKQKTREIDNKVKDYYNQFLLLEKQLQIANETYINYKTLLRNELLRFQNGESSLFLVNSRENKVLEIQQKIIETELKLLKAKYSLDWAAGLLQ
jgi:outer membrane protein TolC